MSIRLNFQVGGYRVKTDVTVPEGRMRAAEMLPVFRELSDAVTRAVIAREQDLGKSISCRKGCSACCKRLYVEVTEAEAYRLRDIVAALPADHRKRVDARFDAIATQLRAAGLDQDMLGVRLDDEESRKKLSLDFYEQGIACPFLEDDACSIYADRPLACREYLVTSPAEACATPLKGGVRRVPFPWPTFDYAMRMTQYVNEDISLVPLALLPEWLARHPEPVECPSGVELLMRSFSGASFDMATASPMADAQTALDGGKDVVGDGVIVPDYEMPDALMVPHYGFEPVELLERIAAEAARHLGVILLTPDPDATQAFIDRQPDPERFSLLVAASDTAWIRDRAPIAVRGTDRLVSWYLPRLPDDGREADAGLFSTICARPARPSPFTMARGNLVAGPDGLALSTNLLLEENTDGEMHSLRQRARRLGISRWIVFTPLTGEPTRHADVHVRFPGPELAAVAWNLSSREDRDLMAELELQLVEAVPHLRVLRIPMRSDGTRYASPLNWIQLGSELLIPRYELTKAEDIEQISELLKAEGFKPTFIESPTLDSGGSLHCLTTSIHVS